MTLKILGGSLSPVVHDGSSTDAVYGVDATGAYLGVVPSAGVAATADFPPPKSGNWRWSGAAWLPYLTRAEQGTAIDAARELVIAQGVPWNGVTWYADNEFQQQLAAFLQAYTEGILPADATCAIRSRDTEMHNLGRDDLRSLAAALIGFVQASYQQAWAQKGAIVD